MFKTLSEFKSYNSKQCYNYFSRSSTRFYKRQFHGGLRKGIYFITSEIPPMTSNMERVFSIREAASDGTIYTASIHAYKTLDDAKSALKLLLVD